MKKQLTDKTKKLMGIKDELGVEKTGQWEVVSFMLRDDKAIGLLNSAIGKYDKTGHWLIQNSSVLRKIINDNEGDSDYENLIGICEYILKLADNSWILISI